MMSVKEVVVNGAKAYRIALEGNFIFLGALDFEYLMEQQGAYLDNEADIATIKTEQPKIYQALAMSTAWLAVAMKESGLEEQSPS